MQGYQNHYENMIWISNFRRSTSSMKPRQITPLSILPKHSFLNHPSRIQIFFEMIKINLSFDLFGFRAKSPPSKMRWALFKDLPIYLSINTKWTCPSRYTAGYWIYLPHSRHQIQHHLNTDWIQQIKGINPKTLFMGSSRPLGSERNTSWTW